MRALATWGRLEVRESWVGLPVVCTLELRFPSVDQPENPQSNPCLSGPVSSRHWCPLNAVPVVAPHSIKDCWYLMQLSRQNRMLHSWQAPSVASRAQRRGSCCRKGRSSSPNLGSERERTFIVPAAGQALLDTSQVLFYFILITSPNWNYVFCKDENTGAGRCSWCISQYLTERGFTPMSVEFSILHAIPSENQELEYCVCHLRV